MISSAQLTTLIGTIYDAAADPGQWSQFLASLSAMTDGSCAMILMHEAKIPKHTVSSSWGFDPEALQLYQERYGELDVWASRGRRGQPKQPGYVCKSESLISLPELARTEFYNDFTRPYDVKHAMFGVVANDCDSLANVSVFRSPAAGPFTDAQLEILQLITPHMQRAFAIHFRFADLQSRALGFESTIDMIQWGVILIDPRGNVLTMNRSANRHVSDAKGLRLRAGKLCAVQVPESERLMALIHAAVKTTVGEDHSAGGTMLVSRPVGRPLSLTVAPLRVAGRPKEPAAVVFIADPDQRTELSGDLLRRGYGLSVAECRLALLLVEGQSLTQIAANTCVSVLTLRTQLKSVFAKTGVKRQGELIQLMLKSSGLVHQ
jgi:DNA-binding CsgD family transcriptional regulator